MFRLKFLSSTNKTIKYLALIMAIALVFFAAFIAIYSDAYYTCCSDDLLQYFKIGEDFAIKLRSGKLSLYSFNNYLGSSFFADTYYIPLDIFTIITFLLSYFMNFEIAFGLTEMFKLFCGTLMFAYFLYLRKCSNKAILVTSLIYFICGYNSVMMAFSAFFSLVFYYPFAAVCLEKYKKGNKLLLPLCSAMLIFYNFYLGACTMLFMGVWFILGYFLDNRLDTVKNQILKVNPNCKHVTIKAILLYLRRGLFEGVICALYMVVGILIACIILLPSLGYFLKDSFPRSDSFYKWSFNSKEGYSQMKAFDMYARILGNLFSPTYSTDFYGFINDYITDHNSLYITITGLIILLYIFKLKDRDSKIFKIVLIIEVIMLMFPIFYMLFSLNGAPYTRWFGMLNMFNLLIVAHVITKTDLNLRLLSPKSLVTSLITIACILLVINFYIQKIYGVNIIGFISGKERTITDRLTDMNEDVIMMIVAVIIIIVLSITSSSKITKKFNLMPYVLAGELIVGFIWMFGPKSYNYNTIYFSDRKEDLNSYMSTYLENPYDSNFSRTTIKSYITDDWVHSDNYSRTNLYLSDLRLFHSFYDCNANDLAEILYDRRSFSEEQRNSKSVINNYSFFVHQALANRYVVVDSGDYYYYLPEEYFTLVNDNGEFASYENKNYYPFMIYDEFIEQGSYLVYDTQLARQQLFLNYASLDDKDRDNIDYVTPIKASSVAKTYYKSDAEIDEETNMIGYSLSASSYGIPSKGVMHFYFNGSDGARTIDFQEVILEYSDGRKENAFSQYAFYDEMPTKIWIYMTSEYNDLSETNKNLKIEYTDYSEYERYLERMQNYSNLGLKMDGENLHLTYHRDNNKENFIVVPVTYNDCWENNKNYEMVKTYGGLLGIFVPEGESDIELTISFKPKYLNGSALISICGIIIYGLIIISNNRRLKEDEENINYCTLL